MEQVERIFADGVRGIRSFEAGLRDMPGSYFEDNHRTVCDKVAEIVRMKKTGQ